MLYDTYRPVAKTRSDSSDTPAATMQATQVLLDDVLVIAMGEASLTPTTATTPEGEEAPTAPVPGALMTVAVTPADAVRLVHGIQTGSLYAALRGTDAKVDLGKVVSEATLFSK